LKVSSSTASKDWLVLLKLSGRDIFIAPGRLYAEWKNELSFGQFFLSFYFGFTLGSAGIMRQRFTLSLGMYVGGMALARTLS
jgi:hypothetical protein